MAKARNKYDFSFDGGDFGFDDVLGSVGDLPDNFDPGLMGDPTSYGLPDPNVDPTFGNDGPVGDTGSNGFNFSGLLGQLGRLLGGNTGGNGSGINLAQLLPLLGLGAGITSGITSSGATREATDAMLRANQQAADLIRGRMEGADAPFKPYQDAGTSALARMQAMPASDLASRFRPLGSGRGMTLGQLAKGR